MKTEITVMQMLTELIPSLEELKRMKTPGKITMAVVRLSNECKKRVQEYEDARIALVKSACQKDEKGNPVIKDNMFQFEKEEDKIAIEKEIKEIADQKILIDVASLDSKLFESVDIAGNLYEVLAHYNFIIDADLNTPVLLKAEKKQEKEEVLN
jgi:hypothetical protein